MRKFYWQRWTLIFMLMARLLIGELGHAMPMTHTAPVDHVAASSMSDSAACSEHDSSEHEAPAAHHDSGKQDCCKSGDCECPCLHAPCSALDTLVLSPIAPTLLPIPHGTDEIPSQRPSGLFRPPA